MTLLDKQKIKLLMLEKNIEHFSDLATMLGISKAQLSLVLSNKFHPIKSNVEKIADFLGVDPLDIIKK